MDLNRVVRGRGVPELAMTTPKLTTITTQASERSTAPDARRSGRAGHYVAHYEVVTARSTGKPGCFDVVLISKTGYVGREFKGSREIVRAWRGRASWSGRPGSPLELALKEAHEMRQGMDPFIQQLKTGDI
jgi:hypothetical protein